MNSSISSSEPLAGVLALRPPSRTARIVIALAVALLAVEAVTRLKLIKMSKEFQQFHSYTPRAAALAQSPGVRIPIIGSSVVHEDVDPALFAARLGSLHDIKVHAVNFTADHSYVDTWYYMLQRYFWRAGNDTDLVVISFVGRGLYDKNEIEIGRLARFFTTIEDWPEVLSTDLTTTSERVEFLLSTFWASYAARDRMQELVFSRLFPNYKTYAYQQQSLLLAGRARAPAGDGGAARHAPLLRGIPDHARRLERAVLRRGAPADRGARHGVHRPAHDGPRHCGLRRRPRAHERRGPHRVQPTAGRRGGAGAAPGRARRRVGDATA